MTREKWLAITQKIGWSLTHFYFGSDSETPDCLRANAGWRGEETKRPGGASGLEAESREHLRHGGGVPGVSESDPKETWSVTDP